MLSSLTNKNVSSLLKVRLGEYDVSVTTEQLPYEELDVSHVMVHPQFNNLSLANDIALLRFVRPARRRSHIDVACMPHPGQVEEIEGTRCIVTGWGRKSEGIVSHINWKMSNLSLFLVLLLPSPWEKVRSISHAFFFLVRKKMQLFNKSATIVD